MSASAMIEEKVILNIQPGEIPPVLHFKEGSDSMDVVLLIKAEDTTLETGGRAVLKGTKPDGASLFSVLSITSVDATYITVDLTADVVKLITATPGKYDCTISIIDSDNAISESDYEDYDLITVQPFTADVEKSAV